MPVITLTTDFGLRDGYVGAMKGVLARLTAATVVDLAHDIPRGDIAHGAWVVHTACREFPEGSIHVVVVDPGVGGTRRGVVAAVNGSYYVGPDNGVFGYLGVDEARAIENREVMAYDVSPTFHGRDVFATVAAALARYVDPDIVGPRIPAAQLRQLPWGPRPAGEGRVVHVDHFGNLISDLPATEAGAAIAIDGRRLPLVHTYEDVAEGELLAYVGSAKTVEIAVRDGRADRVLAAPRGTAVVPVPAGSEFR
jgi:S-adenosyl-L-methionine hydrolase (adenosine-forming)